MRYSTFCVRNLSYNLLKGKCVNVCQSFHFLSLKNLSFQREVHQILPVEEFGIKYSGDEQRLLIVITNYSYPLVILKILHVNTHSLLNLAHDERFQRA